ncbi:MAG: HesB/IscA family protein [Nitrospiria bacterium]
MVILTEKAGENVKGILDAEQKTGYGLRVQISGGGCSGFQYGMTFEEKANERDNVYESNGIRLFVDPKSAPLLEGVKAEGLFTSLIMSRKGKPTRKMRPSAAEIILSSSILNHCRSFEVR